MPLGMPSPSGSPGLTLFPPDGTGVQGGLNGPPQSAAGLPTTAVAMPKTSPTKMVNSVRRFMIHPFRDAFMLSS